jgi:diadenosine tetraphosphate (Ap4A) HIT family hydrolase
MPINMTEPYDDGNIFARILRGVVPCDKVYEDEWTFAFHDIRPQAPVHVLVVPKGRYVCWDDFAAKASDAEQAALTRAIGTVARQMGLGQDGYRLMVNVGHDGHQEVPHLHVHILGGRQFRLMVAD